MDGRLTSIPCNALRRARELTKCRAVLVVHPNNPTGSYVKPHEADELNRICAANRMAIIADEVFLDYSLGAEPLHLLVESQRAHVYLEWAFQDFRAAADESRLDCRQRPRGLESEALRGWRSLPTPICR